MIDRDELAAWLRLLETPGVGRESARRLLGAFGSPQAVFEAPPGAWREVVVSTVATALAAPPDALPALLATTLAWLNDAEAVPRSIVTLGDGLYPDALLNTADPPLLLYAQGHAELLGAESVAVVGSRNPTPQGADNARNFGRHISSAGFVVASGLALGVDGAAHVGALDGFAAGGASSIAVLGSGLDLVYPRRHVALAQRLSRDGLLLSEYALGTPALPPLFPQRNRIIAGLARGTLVVEAALQSGSLITARLASEAGREVFAIPGSIHSPQSRGCHALIRQGAKLVETVQDILDELRPGGKPTATSTTAPAKAPTETTSDPLLDALGHEPVGLDALSARTGWSAAQLSAKLLELELQGLVARLPGQLFQRLANT